MSRTSEPSCKKCRRNKQKLFLKGARCLAAKCSLDKRNFPPGKNSSSLQKKSSDYGIRLREKQKVKAYYGISEAQLRRIYQKADRSHDMTGHVLLSLCERRVDNLLFRSKFARSRQEARLLVTHGHVLVNGKKMDIPSFVVKIGDEITIKAKTTDIIKKHLHDLKDIVIPNWLSVNETTYTISIVHYPARDEIDVPVQEQLVVEYYSR